MHGIHSRNFPNAFVIGFVQAGNLVSNITHNLVESARTISAVVSHAIEVGADVVEVSEDAELEWVSLIEKSERLFLGNPECTPGYYNNEGKPMGRRERLNSNGYPDGPVEYFSYIDAWRRSGTFDGLEFSTSASH
jgi:hypothetical protein